ncbi:MAG TPA: TonB-dependent receptor [Bacteroidota bacterium]|nr:TonB-dependent receptor [Bacteroidota bacterium]
MIRVFLVVLAMGASSVIRGNLARAGSGNLSADGQQGREIKFTVYDADENIPIELARIALQRNGKLIAEEATNAEGQARLHHITPGSYTVTAWFVGYRIFRDSIRVDESHTSFRIDLHIQKREQRGVDIIGERDLGVSNIDMNTGNQTFESETYHPPPTAQMTNLIQENLTGAARAPTSEVHIRGSHGEFTYYIDGIPVPLGVFGGLNEVVDPKVIDRATFITGGFPAEYGGQMSAVIDLNNRVPTGSFHLDASTYIGSYLVFNGTRAFSPGAEVSSGPSSVVAGDTLGGRVGPFRALTSDGEALSMSDHIGKLGFYISGTRQETDRRIDTPVPNLFHDHGFDYFLYGKFDDIVSDIDYITANLSFGRTSTQIPYDPTVQIASDLQATTNALQSVSYFHILNSQIEREENLFLGAYAREGGLTYTPGDIDPPNFQFTGDSAEYNLCEDRSFTTLGIRSTFDQRISHQFMYKVGYTFSSTHGAENFTSRDSLQNPGPSIFTNFAGSDFGIFAETEWRLLDWASFDVGARYDQHIAPDVPLQNQVSPRIRWNFLIDENNSAYLYYGRLFMPANIEALRSIAQNVSKSVTATFPERDSYYEAVYTHSFPFSLRLKTAAFFKYSSPFTDDAQIGNTAIKTPFNIATVKTTGIEYSLSYSDPATPFSGHLNSSIIHAIGSGPLTGGFLKPSTDGSATDLDHDQRLSIVAVVNYQPQDWFINLEGTYGSGLSNGHPEDVSVYKTGLFDFNQSAHTAPYWILNCSAGHMFHLSGGDTFEPSIYAANLLDHLHLVKGAYTTGASWEEPRNVVFMIAVHI